MRVLICDDEQKMIDLEVSMLQKYCQSANVIATFYAFTDSLSAENTDEFDIAFLDIDMAELNGIELARRLRLKIQRLLSFLLQILSNMLLKDMKYRLFVIC